MTFEAVDYSFENKCYVVRGDNKDNDGQLSNGSGKTSLVDVVAVALLGYSLTGRNLKDCCRWDSEESFFTVSLEMENFEHKQTCSIQRKIYNNTKSGELVLLVNGEVPATIPRKKGVENGVDIKAGDAYILEAILDLNTSDLLNYYLISSKYYQPFLKVNTDKKLEVIHRFSKAEVVDKALDKLALHREYLTDSVVEYDRQINATDGYLESLEDSLDSDAAKKAFEEEREANIDQLNVQLEEVQEKLLELESKKESLQTNIDEFGQMVQPVDEEWLAEIGVIIKKAKKQLADYPRIKRAINANIDKTEKYLNGLIVCPKCDHEFCLGGHEDDLTYTQDDLKAYTKELYETEKEEKLLEKEIQKAEKERDDVDKIKASNILVEKTVELKENEIASIVSSQERLAKEYAYTEEKIDKEKKKTFADKKKVTEKQIKEKAAERAELIKQQDQVKDELNTVSKWVDYFEDFRFYLGNKPLELICSLVNQYLKFNGSDLNLHIEGFKKLKGGEIRQALNPVIYRNWMNPKDYSQFSEGEKTRLNLSTDLAFQQLINSSSKYGGLDFYLNDELLNPLDSLGIKGAAESFNRLDKTILLVSQAGADLNYENTVLVEKKNGISSIV